MKNHLFTVLCVVRNLIKDNEGMSLDDYYEHDYPSFTQKEIYHIIALELLKIRYILTEMCKDET